MHWIFSWLLVTHSYDGHIFLCALPKVRSLWSHLSLEVLTSFGTFLCNSTSLKWLRKHDSVDYPSFSHSCGSNIVFYFSFFYILRMQSLNDWQFFKFIYFEREFECVEWGRERERENSCTVSTEPNMGLKLMTHEIITWAEIKSWTLNRLSHPGTPQQPPFEKELHYLKTKTKTRNYELHF